MVLSPHFFHFQLTQWTIRVSRFCVHQTDLELKHAGVASFAAFVSLSECVLLLWSPSYFKRLWCMLVASAAAAKIGWWLVGFGANKWMWCRFSRFQLVFLTPHRKRTLKNMIFTGWTYGWNRLIKMRVQQLGTRSWETQKFGTPSFELISVFNVVEVVFQSFHCEDGFFGSRNFTVRNCEKQPMYFHGLSEAKVDLLGNQCVGEIDQPDLRFAPAVHSTATGCRLFGQRNLQNCKLVTMMKLILGRFPPSLDFWRASSSKEANGFWRVNVQLEPNQGRRFVDCRWFSEECDRTCSRLR